MKIYKDEELRYSAYTRCDCGAGLAYPLESSFNGYWDCSDILTGRAIPNKGIVHCPQLPFIFYEIKSEYQPSANGASTRPNVNESEDK